MTDQEQINALKAQVNCLRHCLQQSRNDSDREAFERCYGKTLAMTTEHCLAEHDARVIEKLKTRFSFWIRTSPETHIYVEDKESDGVFDSFPQFLGWYAKELREQAKC